MFEVSASTTISADVSTVWATLMDTSSWPKWNTFVTKLDIHPPYQRLEVGSKQTIQIAPDATNPSQVETYSNVVTELREGEKLVWEGVLVSGVVFKTRHWCLLESIESGKTIFTQGEDFSGVLAPVVWLTGKTGVLERGYVRMNEDLKRKCEERRA